MVNDWKSDIAAKTQKVEELLINVNWAIERKSDKLLNCNDECQKEEVTMWLEEAKELIDEVLKILRGGEVR